MYTKCLAFTRWATDVSFLCRPVFLCHKGQKKRMKARSLWDAASPWLLLSSGWRPPFKLRLLALSWRGHRVVYVTHGAGNAWLLHFNGMETKTFFSHAWNDPLKQCSSHWNPLLKVSRHILWRVRNSLQLNIPFWYYICLSLSSITCRSVICVSVYIYTHLPVYV